MYIFTCSEKSKKLLLNVEEEEKFFAPLFLGLKIYDIFKKFSNLLRMKNIFKKINKKNFSLPVVPP
jgi:hypothetical protein